MTRAEAACGGGAASAAALTLLLWRRKAASLRNAVLSLTAWEWARNAAFALVGLWMLAGLYAGFLRVLRFLDGVQLIGPLLVWKLTAMALLTTFSMVTLSSLIISLTTLFYSFDLPFLLKAPLPVRVVFLDKSLEAAFFSSWMIALVLFPFIAALGAVRGAGWGFYVSFAALLVPFLLAAAAAGMGFTLVLMYAFPSSRTRDVIWVLSSLSVALVYVLLRFSEPEKLIRPDALTLVAEYLAYLQAPTAPALPSWWMTRAAQHAMAGRWPDFWAQAGLLCGAAAAAYGLLVWLAGPLYPRGCSGAAEARRSNRRQEIRPSLESAAARLAGAGQAAAALLWKDRKSFLRDVKHWSQLVLVAALVCVYLFSIRRLPLDTPDLRSLVCFLNLAIAGFVLSSLGLRFTFPAISLEGRCFWVLRASPLRTESLMQEKFFFTLVPGLAVSLALVVLSNRFLQADGFISALTLATMALMTWTLCGMGVGFGAMFPRFDYTNIHQIESSAGGFVYMAACLGYVAATVALEALPVQMHFAERFGRPAPWRWGEVSACAAALAALNAAAFCLPWWLGRKALERHE